MFQAPLLEVAVPCPLYQTFTYLVLPGEAPDHLQPGVRLKVPFGRREVIGIYLRPLAHPLSEDEPVTYTLKSILAIVDEAPILDPHMLWLLEWASHYYQHPLGEVCSHGLPSLLRKGRAVPQLPDPEFSLPLKVDKPALNQHQQHAVEQVTANLCAFKVWLLHGVTGSGKTEVYLHCIQQVVQNGGQALVLVPEIGLTPQTIERFQQFYRVPVIAMHSGMTDKQRLVAWTQAKNQQAKIIIGTRSAIFLCLPALQMIVVDEEHDASFKQQEGFRYSARDLAVIRAQRLNIPIILGSATPSLESIHNAELHRYALLTLPQRAVAATKSVVRMIDLRCQSLEQGLSVKVIAAMKQHLEQKGQVLLFLNRRGFATQVVCHHCGEGVMCLRCDTAFTYHQQQQRLVCHHCTSQKPVPTACPACGYEGLFAKGLGTERIETTLAQHFPEHRVLRIDRDSTRKKGSFDAMLEQIRTGQAEILIGTQMLAKGHDFPNISLVVIVNGDQGLLSGDLRASERMGQLITQVAGRAGRGEKSGEVLLQTHQPDHPLLQTLVQQGFWAYAQSLLVERKALQWPPFSYLALLRAEAPSLEKSLQFLDAVKHALQSQWQDALFLGPIPAPMQKKAGKFRAQLLLQSHNRKLRQALLNAMVNHLQQQKLARSVRWSLDVDPFDLF